MFDNESERIPECLRIAADMLNITVEDLEHKHNKLFNKLLNIRHYIRTIKPYGDFASTQVIGSVIANYFAEKEINSRILYLEDKTCRLDDFGRFTES